MNKETSLILENNFKEFKKDILSRKEVFKHINKNDLERYFEDLNYQLEQNYIDGVYTISLDLIGHLIAGGGNNE